MHASLDKVLEVGLPQTAEYADYCGAETAHLLIFDRRPEITWEQKIWCRSAQQGAREITLWGL